MVSKKNSHCTESGLDSRRPSFAPGFLKHTSCAPSCCVQNEVTVAAIESQPWKRFFTTGEYIGEFFTMKHWYIYIYKDSWDLNMPHIAGWVYGCLWKLFFLCFSLTHFSMFFLLDHSVCLCNNHLPNIPRPRAEGPEQHVNKYLTCDQWSPLSGALPAFNTPVGIILHKERDWKLKLRFMKHVLMDVVPNFHAWPYAFITMDTRTIGPNEANKASPFPSAELVQLIWRLPVTGTAWQDMRTRPADCWAKQFLRTTFFGGVSRHPGTLQLMFKFFSMVWSMAWGAENSCDNSPPPIRRVEI